MSDSPDGLDLASEALEAGDFDAADEHEVYADPAGHPS
jgi:hypothetical protein